VQRLNQEAGKMTRRDGATDNEAVATGTHRAWITQGVAIPMVTRPDAAERCGYAADEQEYGVITF